MFPWLDASSPSNFPSGISSLLSFRCAFAKSVLKAVENVGEACPNGEPLKRAAGHGETADSQPRKEAFCVDNYRVFDEFSSFDRVRIWASAKLLDDGGGGRRRNSSKVFSSASPLAQLFWARETHHKHGSF